ncbi:3-ketosteroid 1-dehydrogenase helE [Aspergillus mulundensis]|uniref:FAD-dependent oxidoreductase 2 FAD-binding domain-containing protein n=1 Tax=Aspergillus mulundensis TaxID=1810919 RepID=A0A3D8QML2_9EURO|nr:hypothetical protein DSM5745_10187 [Aspergillus mulundensis]RDW63076.1 hypothetical protein DSM5745_10187 [Aspergillus mulundensis]
MSFNPSPLPLITTQPNPHPSRLQSATRTQTKTATPEFAEETDLLIIGSGAGALTANLRARSLGLRSILIEKEDLVGGASAISGGGFWIPCNPISGVADSKDAALTYFAQAVGDVGPASSLEKRDAFVSNGARMVEFLRQHGFEFHVSKGYPDYYPRMEGAMGGGGRSLEARVFDMRRVGVWEGRIRPSGIPVAMYTHDGRVFSRVLSSVVAFGYVVRRMLPLFARMVVGQRPASMGRALVGQLLHLNLKHDGEFDLRTQTGLSKLIQDPTGRVVGAEVRTADACTSIRATRGIILAAGGFAHNKEMRETYLPSPATTDWTSSPPGDTGDAIQEGIRIGAATALMDDAWWGPTIIDPVTLKPHFALMERSVPHCFIVDSSGARFMNEAESYTDAGHDQYTRNETVKAIPAWLILDSNHRERYMLGRLLPKKKPSKQALGQGVVITATSLAELARKTGIDPTGLVATTKRYNEMCKTGVDEDFGKGSNAYDQFFGDPVVGPNPNMGPLLKPPFYATAVWPGDLGTKGGLLTDEFQRVLDKDANPIPGLFAIGNTAASIMGRTYLGAGSSLGPAMTHGYIAADFISKELDAK